jgi:hypothetical protein
LVTSGSLGASSVSEETILKDYDELMLEFEWSAGSTPVGNLSIEVCSDLGSGARTTWNTLEVTNTLDGTTSSNMAVSGNSGKHVVNFESAPFGILRIRYTRTSGSGTLNVWVSGKSLGGTV